MWFSPVHVWLHHQADRHRIRALWCRIHDCTTKRHRRWRRAMRPTTKLLFAETSHQPADRSLRYRYAGRHWHSTGALLAVDNCFATPALQNPLPWEQTSSCTQGPKFLDGQGRVMAGALCASEAMVLEKFLPVQKHCGMVLAPFNAWVVIKGPGNTGLAHAGAKRQRAGACPVAARAPCGSACTTPVCKVIPSTRWPCGKCLAWAVQYCL